MPHFELVKHSIVLNLCYVSLFSCWRTQLAMVSVLAVVSLGLGSVVLNFYCSFCRQLSTNHRQERQSPENHFHHHVTKALARWQQLKCIMSMSMRAFIDLPLIFTNNRIFSSIFRSSPSWQRAINPPIVRSLNRIARLTVLLLLLSFFFSVSMLDLLLINTKSRLERNKRLLKLRLRERDVTYQC